MLEENIRAVSAIQKLSSTTVFENMENTILVFFKIYYYYLNLVFSMIFEFFRKKERKKN